MQKYFALLIVLTGLLVACGNRDAATAVADPAANFIPASSDLIGVTIQHPPDWTVEIDESSGDMTLVSDAALLPEESRNAEGAFFFTTQLPEGMAQLLTGAAEAGDPETVLSAYVALFAGEGEELFTEREEMQPITIDGRPAAQVRYDITGPDGDAVGLFTAVQNGEEMLLMFGLVDKSQEAALLPVVEAMTSSVTLQE